MPETHFIDLSHHNTVNDFSAAKAAGITGVIHKATEGKSYVDPTMAQRRVQAKAAGLKWATYHFLRSGDPEGQMAHYLKAVNPEQGERVVIDHEQKATLTELRAAVSYIAVVRPDLQISIYSGHTIKEQLTFHDEVLAGTSLWIAQYNNSGPIWPTETWPYWSAWQFTDRGSINGIVGNVDCNEFNGSREACSLWFGPVSESEMQKASTGGLLSVISALIKTLFRGSANAGQASNS